MDMKPAPEIISRRLKDQLAPAYLTLTSIIQGVALAFLAARVEATSTRFDTTNWLLTIATFVGLLTVWNEKFIMCLVSSPPSNSRYVPAYIYSNMASFL